MRPGDVEEQGNPPGTLVTRRRRSAALARPDPGQRALRGPARTGAARQVTAGYPCRAWLAPRLAWPRSPASGRSPRCRCPQLLGRTMSRSWPAMLSESMATQQLTICSWHDGGEADWLERCLPGRSRGKPDDAAHQRRGSRRPSTVAQTARPAEPWASPPTAPTAPSPGLAPPRPRPAPPWPVRSRTRPRVPSSGVAWRPRPADRAWVHARSVWPSPALAAPAAPRCRSAAPG